jgi:hypothetical protein
MHHVLCVAAQERQAEELSVALAQLTEVLVVGLCDPHQAATMARVVGAELIVTLAGTPLPPDVAALNIPTLSVPQGISPVEAVLAYLQKQSEAQAAPPEEAPPHPGSWLQPPARLQMRIGFYGLRGGVGVTTAAVTAAQLLAAAGQRVALYDATRRGDPYLLLGRLPSEEPTTVGNLTLYPNLILDDSRVAHEALVIDGGRERRLFPARWFALDRPLAEAEIRRLLG